MHDPTEHVQEHIQHTAAHGDHGHDDHGGSSKWITGAALTAAFLAAFAAVGGAQATHHLTESTLKRIEANDLWTYYQSKSVKKSEIDTRILNYNIYHTALPAGAAAAPEITKQHKDDVAKKAEYADLTNPDSMPRIQEHAKSLEEVSKRHLETHETYEFSATMFHISIALVAVAVVAKRRSFWFVSIVLGIIGLCYLGKAYTRAPAIEPPEEPAATAPATESVPAKNAPAAEHAAEHPAMPERAEHPATAPSPHEPAP